ncbi:hypothetical protein, partial [Escherichia coli]|uniref:hypothetical protein n=1 Tax=Escherichia coli TaxID=562 RepID=UPI001BC86E52
MSTDRTGVERYGLTFRLPALHMAAPVNSPCKRREHFAYSGAMSTDRTGVERYGLTFRLPALH